MSFQSNAFQSNAFQMPGIGSVGGGRRYYKPSELEKELKERRPFSRTRFDELLAAQQAQEEAELKAAELGASKRKTALRRAAEAAQAAIDAVKETESAREADFARMTMALEAASSAKRVADVIRETNIAVLAAQAILAEIEDEEEAEMLLLH